MARFGRNNYDDSNGEYIDLQSRVEWLDPNETRRYSDVYTEDGDAVICENCGCDIMWNDETGEYMCPWCGHQLSRVEFFDYIGAEPPGSRCITCSELYPGCTSCPHGYIKDDNIY